MGGPPFYRTYVNSGSGPTGQADPASVSDFRLDKYEVTVGRFRQFVGAWNNGAGYVPPAGSGKHTHLNGGQGLANSGGPGTFETGWIASDDANVAPTVANLQTNCFESTWTTSPGSKEDMPMNCISWFEAYAFCIWDGGFLPSEAEWEYAAAGGPEQREYPWGPTDPGTANQYAIYGCNYPGSNVCTPAPVGHATLGAGLWGQLDLAGNVFEWNLDWFAASGTYVDPCTDCAYLDPASLRVDRGGRFDVGTASMLPTYLGNYPPADRFFPLGVRCARTP
jgi:formylglycine-generating enzyme required for sulfatase activity